MGKSKPVKIDEDCVRALNDIKKKVGEESLRRYGFVRDVSDREASKILGIKYWRKNFGKMPIEDVMKILKKKTKVI